MFINLSQLSFNSNVFNWYSNYTKRSYKLCGYVIFNKTDNLLWFESFLLIVDVSVVSLIYQKQHGSTLISSFLENFILIINRWMI